MSDKNVTNIFNGRNCVTSGLKYIPEYGNKTKVKKSRRKHGKKGNGSTEA